MGTIGNRTAISDGSSGKSAPLPSVPQNPVTRPPPKADGTCEIEPNTQIAPTNSEPASSAFRTWVRGGILLALAASLCQFMECRKLVAERNFLRDAVARWADANRKRAHAAFDAGSFEEAVDLLEPVALQQEDDIPLELLYARSLECIGRFDAAATAYARLAGEPNAPVFVQRGLKFCERMARHRGSSIQSSREIDYRLFDELMRRGQADTAHFVARRLNPDQEPLRASIGALLHQADRWAELTLTQDGTRVDVTLTNATPATLGWLRELRIGTLSLADARLREAHLLAGLDVEGLVLARNPLSDLSSLSIPRLERLDLSGSPVADLRALANLPLKELDLSHSNVSSLMALSLCPLQRLNLAGLAIRDLAPLRGIALRSLDLSHTGVADLSPIASLPLDELNLEGAPVPNLQPLVGMKLRKLSLARTAISDLAPLTGMPLVELDLRGCAQIRDLSALAGCLRLERLRLPDHLKATAAVMQLPRLKFIEYEHLRGQPQNTSANLTEPRRLATEP